MSYSLQYLPEEDRLLLLLHSGEQVLPCLLLTRRFVALWAQHLRQRLEVADGQHSRQDKGAMASDQQVEAARTQKQQQLLEDAPFSWDSRPATTAEEAPWVLPTKVDITLTEERLGLVFYRYEHMLVRMDMSLAHGRYLLYALGQMAQKADWGLEDVFGWALAGEDAAQQQALAQSMLAAYLP